MLIRILLVLVLLVCLVEFIRELKEKNWWQAAVAFIFLALIAWIFHPTYVGLLQQLIP